MKTTNNNKRIQKSTHPLRGSMKLMNYDVHGCYSLSNHNEIAV
jgi:hypothetical protein